MAPTPELSVVVVVFNIPREAARTLHSLSAAYQRGIDADAYEVIVVDNGSSPPFDPASCGDLEGNFRFLRLDPAPASPARAINLGLSEARGRVIGVMIDGARLATPGLLNFARHGAGLGPRAVVATLGWYLGADLQSSAVAAGYDRTAEDALLERICWPEDGYRLFEIGTVDESSVGGWVRDIVETNALFLSREDWDELGGADERFDEPGGGLLNLDIYRRAMDLPGAELVLLLGEATFHQVHGGIATNADPRSFEATAEGWHRHYETIRGARYIPPQTASRIYVGRLPPVALADFTRSVLASRRRTPNTLPGLDQTLWAFNPPDPQSGEPVASLIELARSRLREGQPAMTAVLARIAREEAPEDEAVWQLLQVAGPALNRGAMAKPKAVLHLARGEAYRILGRPEQAEDEYRRAIQMKPNLVEAHVGLSLLRMPGPDYYDRLRRLHAALRPKTYVEIGIGGGSSLALAKPPTRAVAVDPAPARNITLNTEGHIFRETSDAFFERGVLGGILGGKLRFGFIDGLHLFEQALRDFINLERFCGRRSVLAFHDTYPTVEIGQERTRRMEFYTGDVWKVVPCLKRYRPELDVFTVPTAWSGLTIVTGLDPRSNVLSERFDEAVAAFIDRPYSDVETNPASLLNLVPNDWEVIASRLRKQGII